MASKQSRFAIVMLVLASTMGVLAVEAGNSTGGSAMSVQDGPGGERPVLKIEPVNENITERNTTTFLVYLGNPPWNTRPKYVVLRIWSPGYADLGLLVNGESPDETFDEEVGWEFHRDLEPGRHAINTVTVGRGSRPGTYSVFATGVYVENGELTTRTVSATVTVNSSGTPGPSLCSRVCTTVFVVVRDIIDWIGDNPERALSIFITAFGVLIALSQLLIALYGRERFLAGVRSPVQRIRSHADVSEKNESDGQERDDSS